QVCTPELGNSAESTTEFNSANDAPRSRFQNVYAAPIYPGLVVMSPSGSKPIVGANERAYVVFVQNLTDSTRSYRFDIGSRPAGVVQPRGDHGVRFELRGEYELSPGRRDDSPRLQRDADRLRDVHRRASAHQGQGYGERDDWPAERVGPSERDAGRHRDRDAGRLGAA